MCLIVWNWQPGTATPLRLLANRDELYARAALPAHWWGQGAGRIFAGKDLQGGGSWLGVSRNGRLAALTNYRSAAPARLDTPSRGELVTNFLHSEAPSAEYLNQLAARADQYNPFNLLVFDGKQPMGMHSRTTSVYAFSPGINGVSNADFDTPWPKLIQLKAGFQAQLLQHTPDLLPLLHDRAVAPDKGLPQTGMPVALERALSAIFIALPTYGTRACSLVEMRQNQIEFSEECYDAHGLQTRTRQAFFLDSTP